MMLWGRKRNVDILEETAELPVEEQLHHNQLQWFGCLQFGEHGSRFCRPNGMKQKPAGTIITAMGRPPSQRPFRHFSTECACEEQIYNGYPSFTSLVCQPAYI